MAETRLTPARLALAAAATVAAAAVGAAVLRDRPGPAPTPEDRAAQAPVGEVGEMIVRLEKRLKGDTTDADGWRMLGWACFETGRFQRSAEAYRQATAIDPSKAQDWSALGEATVMAEKGRVSPAAEKAFRRALSVDPRERRARYFLAVGKDMAGDHKGAVDDWIALLNDGPVDAPWAAEVRRLATKVAADHGIDIAGRLPPGNLKAAYLPDIYTTAGPADAAAGAPGPTPDQVRAAASLPPARQEAMARGMVGRLAARLAREPKDPDGWIGLMRARMVLNDPAAARQALASAKAANPDDAARLTDAARALGVPGG